MQKVQVFIGTEELDLFKDENISMTLKITDIKDISKVFAPFSQSFTVPASKKNNKIFKHYYNFNITDGFDARRKASGSIKLNYKDYKSGNVKLNKVSLKNGKAEYYDITFFGELINMKDVFGEDELSDMLFLNNFSFFYNYANVLSYYSSTTGYSPVVGGETFTSAIVIPLITHTQGLYYDTAEDIAGTGNLANFGTQAHGVEWTQLKPSLRLWCIVRAIEETYTIANGYPYDVVFSRDFFTTSNVPFYGLYMWLHRNKGEVPGLTSGTYSAFVDTMTSHSFGGLNFYSSYFTINDIFTYGSSYYGIDIDYSVSSTISHDIVLKKSGAEIQRHTKFGATSYNVDFGNLTQNGTYTIHIESTVAPITFFATTGDINLERNNYFTGTTFDSSTVTSFTLSADVYFTITEQIPKMKVIDFVSALFNMFNLVAEVEDGTINVLPLNDYYTAGNELDVTQYIDTQSSSVMPAQLFKNITFRYKDTKTYWAARHEEEQNDEWGTEDYTGGDWYDGQTYKVEIPFMHMKFQRLYSGATATPAQYGWMVDKVDEDGTPQSYLGLPLIHYIKRQVSATAMRLTNSGTYTGLANYHIPLNSTLITDSDNINFKAEISEYDNTVFNDTLYSTYYNDYIVGIFDPASRITKVSGIFPIKIIETIRLNDTIIIGANKYRINEMKTVLQTGKTELELINIPRNV